MKWKGIYWQFARSAGWVRWPTKPTWVKNWQVLSIPIFGKSTDITSPKRQNINHITQQRNKFTSSELKSEWMQCWLQSLPRQEFLWVEGDEERVHNISSASPGHHWPDMTIKSLRVDGDASNLCIPTVALRPTCKNKKMEIKDLGWAGCE